MSDWDYLQPEFYKFGSDSLPYRLFFLKGISKGIKTKRIFSKSAEDVESLVLKS